MQHKIIDDMIDESLKAKNNISAWKKRREELKPQFAELRKIIMAISQQDGSKPVALIGKMDGLLSLPVIIQMIEEIKQANILEIERLLANKNLAQIIKNVKDSNACDPVDKLFKKVIGHSIGTILEDYLYKEVETVDKFSAESFLTKIQSLLVQVNKAITPGEALDSEIDKAQGEKLRARLHYHVFLICLFKTYTGADEKQLMGTWEQMKFAATYNDHKLRLPFMALNTLMTVVKLPTEHLNFWQEEVIWLEGLYQRVRSAIPSQFIENNEVKKCPDGFYPTIDGEDGNLKKYFKITKYDISLYHLEMVGLIKNSLTSQRLEAQPNLAGVEPAAVKIAESDGIALVETLKLFEREPEARQINALIIFAKCYGLSPAQKSLLNTYIATDIKREFNQYLNFRDESWAYYLFHFFRKGRCHTREAQALIAKLQAIPEADNSRDPLAALINFRSMLIDKGSRHLLERVDAVLLGAYTLLSKLPPARLSFSKP